ncbi:4'-phosphopantetheinyl transferase superfamily protein [Streptomyces sp. CB03234]|uniref:4'-phosphopantetheinyl transferase superfamily protein n=1 Tax=Streptomyces sp. (strain CB03234) TaxID=1703937 RepID=UPI00093BF5B8|nr:4'-phosphopantetheinyl transferase superfamily protein [Streptomyces sp. CB03234]
MKKVADAALSPGERETVMSEPSGPQRTRAFLRCWARKKPVLKALGTGIISDLTTLETQPWNSGPQK